MGRLTPPPPPLPRAARQAPKGCGLRPVGDALEVHMVLRGLVDFDSEIAKLGRSVEAKAAELARLDEAMAAPSWAKVPEAVREQTTGKADGLRVELEALREGLAAFEALKASQ